jgi:hypothetical protein
LVTYTDMSQEQLLPHLHNLTLWQRQLIQSTI